MISKKEKIMPANHKTTSFPIVGIGASAGGLEAYQQLLKNLSAKPGMAIVFIMHLAPGRKSMLTELLAKSTKMPVREIKSGMLIEINHVYIIPPGANVSIASGRLKLNKMKDAGLKRMPIDWFFRSLAEEQGNRSIGVILSGTATDGTLGAEAIKAEGGITFAQDEKTAKYGGMPQSAITAGCVDFVLSPKKIARELERIAKHPLISSAGLVKADKSTIMGDKGLGSIFDILHSAKGLDFTHYKTTTISRRISRRMVLLKLENLKSYIKFLRENKDEVEELYEDLLLKVTSFFRDPKVFHTLKKQVIPAILRNKTKGQEVRIWVPGCSTGEEAYSIAICLIEAMGNKKSAVSVRIFATDVSENGIDKARRGIYGENIKNDFTPEQLKRFFTKTGNSYKVSKLLREVCIFSKQNVFSDPPFSNVDLISCRNLIIYLQPVLQKEVFHKFHYALRPGGFLLLGNSESAGGYSHLFKTLDRKSRIFVKKYLSVESKLGLDQRYYPPNKLGAKEKTDTSARRSKEAEIESMIERIVLSEYAPCGVLVDSDMEVVQFRGHTGRFLESAEGKPSLNLFKLAPKGLFQPLHTAIYKAKGTKRKVKIESEDVKYNGRRMRVGITVIPVKSRPLKEEFFLVLFDEIAGKAGLEKLPKAKRKSAKDENYVESLQKELSETKEYLQSIIEEQENVNEEVKTANEEILSSNEELLSTNEELETAKEELQSSNEELITTNEELQNRNKEVVLLNDDLINFLNSCHVPVVMMGTNLVIRRITPQAEKVLNIVSSDIGRPISKIKLNIDIPDLENILSDVINSLQPKTFEIKSREGNWYSVYIRPYRTSDNKTNGVVAIFFDVTELKNAQQITEQARAYAESIVETMREPLIVLDADLKVISANRSFYQTFKVNHEETEGRFIYDLGNRQWDIPKLRHLLEELLIKNGAFDNYEIEHDFETIGPKTMLFNARRLATMRMILITIDDITERKKAEEKLKETMSMKSDFISMVSHELRTPLTVIKEGIALVTDGSAGEINEEQRELLGLSKKHVDRLAKLINDVLDFQKLEAGRMKTCAQPNDINEIVREVCETMTLAAKDRGVDLLLELEDGLPIVGFDKDKITQVLTNLVDNAMKFTEKGNIVIKTSKKKGMIHVSVSDTGCGIKKKDLPRVFGRFEQLSSGGERKTGGTGLGLAISKGIIEQHNGEIWVDSVFGKGTTFIFTLPICNIEEPFIKYVNDGIKEASTSNTRMSLALVSIADFDKVKQKLSQENIASVLKDVEAILENDLHRRKGGLNRITDAVFRFSDEIFIVLSNCGKEDIPAVKERLEQKLDAYLADKSLADKVRLFFGCVTYPDDAVTSEGLIKKARESRPMVLTTLPV